jgi:hypothetical protein
MKTILVRIARVVSCILLPVGTIYLANTLFLLPSKWNSISLQVLGNVLIVTAILILFPIFVITSTGQKNSDRSNRKLICTLILIGFVPVLLVFAFFTLVWTHD